MIRQLHPQPKIPGDTLDLERSLRVLSAVVTELSERIEVLETREVLARSLRPATFPSD